MPRRLREGRTQWLRKRPKGPDKQGTCRHRRARHKLHGCAFAAFVEQAIAQRGPPDMVATRRRAYQLYVDASVSKNAVKPHRR